MSKLMSDHEQRLRLLRWLIAFTVVSTAIHYTHNFVEVDSYPQSGAISNTETQVGVLVVWPLLTAIGLYGYRLYRQRRYIPANLCIGAYSSVGILTLGHFASGNPDIPAFFYATLFTDAIGGFALLSFAVWSALAPLDARAPAAA